jgi:hypothetical protein
MDIKERNRFICPSKNIHLVTQPLKVVYLSNRSSSLINGKLPGT